VAGALDLGHFIPPPIRIDEKDCKVQSEFPKVLQKPMEDLVDAFLYLGPQDLRLKEKIPADIVLDDTYRTELQRGGAMLGFPDAASETPNEFDRQIVKTAEDPIFAIPKQARSSSEESNCGAHWHTKPVETGRMGKHAPHQISRETGGPFKYGFGLSGAVLQLDKVFLPLFRVFVPLISDSISTRPMQTLNTTSLHSADHRARDDLLRSG